MRTMNERIFDSIRRFVDDYRGANGISPTIYDIAEGVGISKSSVSRYLAYMRENGMLDYSGRRTVVTGTSDRSVRVPVLGSVSCGIPKLAEENIDDYVSLPVSIFGSGRFFLLRANGDSMTEAGIDDGDLVLIRQQDSADPGQIVVALVDDDATLKRFYPENGRVRLQPENSAMEPIYVEHCTVQGVAVRVLKDLE